MGKIPQHLRETIARNIRQCRLDKFPGRGGGKRCAETFGVSPQQWSPWERGMRTPDELRLEELATFFNTTVEWLRTDHQNARPASHNQATPTPVIPPGAPPIFYSVNYQVLCQIMMHAAHIQTLCAHALAEGAERTEEILGGLTPNGYAVKTDKPAPCG